MHGGPVPADLLDSPGDTVTMQRAEDVESLKDHQRQSALRNVRFSFHCQRPFGFQQEAYSTVIGNTTGRPRAFRVRCSWMRLRTRLQWPANRKLRRMD